MALIIDSGIFISLERQRRNYQDFLAELPAGELVAIASMTASELLSGVQRADTEQRRDERSRRVEELLGDIVILPFGLEAARVHSQVWVMLRSSGLTIGPYDAIIAATALANGYDVLTDNIREFSRVPGLVVRQPNW
jgi:predicted nucleic acid-binding protein